MKRLVYTFILILSTTLTIQASPKETPSGNEAKTLYSDSPQNTLIMFTRLMFSGTGKEANTRDLAKATLLIEPSKSTDGKEVKTGTLKKALNLFALVKSVNYDSSNIIVEDLSPKTATIILGDSSSMIELDLIKSSSTGWIFARSNFRNPNIIAALEHIESINNTIAKQAADFIPELSSPLNTYYTFKYGVQNINGYHLNNATNALDLSAIDANVVGYLGEIWAIQIYRMLYFASPVQPENLSNNPLYPENVVLLLDANYGMMSIKPHFNKATGKKSWKIDISGVRGLNTVYDSFMDKGLINIIGHMGIAKLPLHVKVDDFFQRYAPAMEGLLFSINIWKYVFAALLVLFTILALPIIKFIARPLLNLIFKCLGFENKRRLEKPLILPLQLCAMSYIWLKGIVILSSDLDVMTYTLIALNIVMCITIALFTCRIINTTCAIAENRFDTNLHIITRVIGKVLQVGVIISAALFLCKVFNVDTTNFLAALGIGGFAFALAGKDTLENFLGSIAIIVDRPFITGDVVKIGNIEGSIQQVGVRSTKILTFENSVITLPNRTFISSSVDNRQLRKWRRYKTTFDILLTTEGSKVEAFTKGVTELIQLLPDSINAQTQVYLYELGTSSLQVYIRVFFVNKGRDAELKFRQELNLQILELAKNLEIRFAFPTQTLHINNEDTTNGNHSSKVEKKGPEENESGYSAGILLARKISPYYDPDK